MGALGVTCFFVISGFLITGLLIKDIETIGQVDLRRFYIRRAFRIFPAFYLYLAVVALLRIFAHFDIASDPTNLTSFLAAATYTWNYIPNPHGLLLGHTWSLSLEEQFYLLWPLCLYFFSLKTCLKIAVSAIVLSPAVRAFVWWAFPVMRPNIYMMLPTHLDPIMVGCAITLARHLGLGRSLMQSLARPLWLLPVALYLAADPFLTDRWRGAFSDPVGMTLDSLAFGIILLHVITLPTLPLGRFLNLPAVSHLGRISYSLYLWQQLFTNEKTHSFPLNVLWIFLCAEASYWLIEKPFLRLRDVTASSATLEPAL